MAEKKAVVKKVEKKNIASMTSAELQKELITLRTDLADAKRSLSRGELVNPRVISATRKQIARTMTQLNHTSATSTKKEDA